MFADRTIKLPLGQAHCNHENCEKVDEVHDLHERISWIFMADIRQSTNGFTGVFLTIFNLQVNKDVLCLSKAN